MNIIIIIIGETIIKVKHSDFKIIIYGWIRG